MQVKRLLGSSAWSFAPEPQLDVAFESKTIVIGRNNVGKSNLLQCVRWLRATAEWFSRHDDRGPYTASGTMVFERPDGTPSSYFSMHAEIEFSDSEVAAMVASFPLPPDVRPEAIGATRQVLLRGIRVGVDTREPVERDFNRRVCFSDGTSFHGPPRVDEPFAADAKKLWGAIGNGIRQRMCQAIGRQIIDITGWRTLTENRSYGQTAPSIVGAWDNPKYEARRDRLKHERLQDLIRTLCQNPDLTLKVSGDQLMVQWGKRYLPLANFGDGIKHLVILAIEMAARSDPVFLIEEPETHLHPQLQRHLAAILRSNTENQLIVSTHSPAILDKHWDAIIRIDHNGSESRVTRCSTRSHMYSILDQLGARASDILQANVVVWVEGPSDRMFVKRCLAMLKPELEEGTHFQLMFYGGRLRRHITIDEEYANELINLLTLSRNPALICDSDRSNANDSLGATRERLIEECKKLNAFYWITSGREIENDLPPQAVARAMRRITGRDVPEIRIGPFEHLGEVLMGLRQDSGNPKYKYNYDAAKVEFMTEFVAEMRREELNPALVGRIRGLANYIGAKNGLEAQR